MDPLLINQSKNHSGAGRRIRKEITGFKISGNLRVWRRA
jgi:hypothetical protein